MKRIVATVAVNGPASTKTVLYEVGLITDTNQWPILINYMLVERHAHITPSIARRLAEALLTAADECEALDGPENVELPPGVEAVVHYDAGNTSRGVH